jgi:hypothetical protein
MTDSGSKAFTPASTPAKLGKSLFDLYRKLLPWPVLKVPSFAVSHIENALGGSTASALMFARNP